MRMSGAVVVALWLFAAPPLLVAPLRAQAPATDPAAAPSDEVRKEASARFRRGVELFHEGAFRAALVEFQRAYAIAPDFRLLYNIGQAQVQVQDYLGANQSYEKYLADGGAEVEPARRAEVETALQALRERVARLAIRVNKEGADVFVDEQRVGTAPLPSTVAVNLGRHRVYARLPDGSAAEKVVDVAGGDLLEVDLEIVAMPVAVAAGAPADAVEDDPPMSPMRRAAIAAWAGAGAFLVGAVVTGVMTGSKTDELDDALAVMPPRDEADPKEVAELRDSADTLALTTDVLGGVAIAAAVAGTVLWFLGAEPEEPDDTTARARLRFGVSARAVGVGVRF